MPKSAFARKSRPAPFAEAQPRALTPRPPLRPLERWPLSPARGVVIAIVLGTLAWTTLAALFWIF